MDIDKQIETLLDRACKKYDVKPTNESFRKILMRNALLGHCTKKGINVELGLHKLN